MLFRVPPERRCKIKALLFLAILSVSEGRRVSSHILVSNYFESRSFARNAERAVHRRCDDGPKHTTTSRAAMRSLQTLDENLKFRKHLKLSAEAIDAMLTTPKLQELARLASEHLKAIMEDPGLLEQSKLLAEQIEALGAEPKVQEWHKLVDEVHGKLKGNRNIQDPEHIKKILKDPEVQEQARLASEELKAITEDQDFVERVKLASEQLKTLMEHPAFEEHSKLFAQQIEAMITEWEVKEWAVAAAQQLSALVEAIEGEQKEVPKGESSSLVEVRRKFVPPLTKLTRRKRSGALHTLDPQPALRRTFSTVTAHRSNLPTASAAPAAQDGGRPSPTRTGSIVAGTYSGLMQFTFAAACASIIFGPVGLPLVTGIQHALLAFVVMQTVVTATTSVPGGVVLAVPSFEVLPFFARFAVICSTAIGAGAPPGTLLATVLVGSILVTLGASALMFAAAEAPVDDVDKLLPPPLQAGLFAAIGWSLYLLSYDTLGLDLSSTLSKLFSADPLRLWLPANLLGLGLWQVSRMTTSPLLFPVFILLTSTLVHGVRLAMGMSVEAARAGGWLMASIAGAPLTGLFRAVSPRLVRWDVLLSPAALKQLVSAVFFGPLVSTVLNYVLLGPLIKKKLDLKHELRSHATAAAASAVGGGYANYIGLSDTVIHRKIGGLDRLSCYLAAAVSALFLVVYPLCAIVGYLPTLVIAAIFVFVGVDFLYDNLLGTAREQGPAAGLATCAVFALCVRYDMLVGLLVGIAGFQVAALRKRRQRRKP